MSVPTRYVPGPVLVVAGPALTAGGGAGVAAAQGVPDSGPERRSGDDSDPPGSYTPKSEYPKEVPINSLDSRFRTWLGSDRGKTVAVHLAPGVYTERSTSGDLGTLDDYSSYVGLCVDVNRYRQLHPGGGPCW